MRRKTPALTQMDKSRGQMVVSAVAVEFSMPDMSIHCRRKGTSDQVHARQVSMYLLCSVFNLSMQRIGDIFGRHYSTAAHAVRLIEQDRDDPVLDAKLVRLETFLRQAPSSPHDRAMEADLC